MPKSADPAKSNGGVADTLVMPAIEDAAARPALHRTTRGFPWAYALLAIVAISAAVPAYVALQPRMEQPSREAAGEVRGEASLPPAVDDRPDQAPIVNVAPVQPAAAQQNPTTVGLVAPATPPRTAVASPKRQPPPRHPATVVREIAPTPPPDEKAAEPEALPARSIVTPVVAVAPPLLFETRALVGSGNKHRERAARLALAEGLITVYVDETDDVLYSFPYRSVISITHSRGRDPMWIPPQGPAPVARAGGTLGRLGIFVEREWVAMRTNTEHQFVALRFDDVLVKRVLLALEGRTGRAPKLIPTRQNER